VELGERDHALFLGLFEAGVMLRSQIADLYFAGSYEAGNKRLQKLLKHGYLGERVVVGHPGKYLPSWITLAEPAFRALKANELVEPHFAWESVKRRLSRSSSTLAHDLGVVDLWVAFARAARRANGHELRRFSTWPYEFQFATDGSRDRTPSFLLPDAFAVLASIDDPTLDPIESALFFEWDRSTEGRTVLRKKAIAYDQYYRTGTFATRCGGSRDDAEEYPFRTIFAVRNEERRNNLLEELARPTGGPPLIHDQFWSATWEEILTDPLGPIYLHIGDYLAATEATMYHPASFVTKYRVRDRDELIQERAVKRALL
jgi:hypothetical protein